MDQPATRVLLEADNRQYYERTFNFHKLINALDIQYYYVKIGITLIKVFNCKFFCLAPRSRQVASC